MNYSFINVGFPVRFNFLEGASLALFRVHLVWRMCLVWLVLLVGLSASACLAAGPAPVQGQPPAKTKRWRIVLPLDKRIGQLRLAREKPSSYEVVENVRSIDLRGEVVLNCANRYVFYPEYEGTGDLGVLEKFPAELLIAIDARNTESIDDSALAKFARLKGLRHLILDTCPITDRGLAAVGKMTGLITLQCMGNGLKGTSLGALAGLKNLRGLSLGSNHMEHSAFCDIGRLTGLEELTLLNADAHDADVLALKPLTNLRKLNLCNNPALTDKGLSVLANFPHLSFLDVASTGCTNKLVDVLKKLKEFKVLRIKGDGKSKISKDLVHRAMPGCQVIEMGYKVDNPEEIFAPLH